MSKIDKTNMEYEARVMLSEKQYLAIKEKYTSEHPDYRKIVNENSYFDTSDLYLTNHHMVLRTRLINNESIELTLKIQKENGCLEINHILTLEENKALLEKGEISSKRIVDELIKNNVDLKKISLITTLKTNRIEIEFDDYLFVLDQNFFRDRCDYNLEVESSSEKLAISRLKEIIAPFGVTYKKDYISKSKRAIYNL